MADFLQYMLRQARTEAARNQRSYASVALEKALIDERLAEIKSQSEPLNALIKIPLSERDRLYAAAFYVVVGRLPAPPTEGDSESK